MQVKHKLNKYILDYVSKLKYTCMLVAHKDNRR